MKRNATKIFLALVGALFLAVILYFVFFYKSADPRTAGLTKVPGYVDQGACTALTPECGLCHGEVINKECYIDKKKLSSDQLQQMGF